MSASTRWRVDDQASSASTCSGQLLATSASRHVVDLPVVANGGQDTAIS
jgi:hypothetical protein